MQNIRQQLISVILPVYNGELYLKDSITSILNQTYINFELIILNDGSTDNSEEVILSFKDSRIRYYKHTNIGLAATLNHGILLSAGELIARQDQDDISLPVRLETQINYINANDQLIIVGSNSIIISDDGDFLGFHKHPSCSLGIRFALLFDNPIIHSSVLIRKAALINGGIYCEDKSRQPPEDYELWSRLSRIGHIENIKESLIHYRESLNGMSRLRNEVFINRVVEISKENISLFIKEKNINPKFQLAVSNLVSVYHRVDSREISFFQLIQVFYLFRKITSVILKDINASNRKNANDLLLEFRKKRNKLLVNSLETLFGIDVTLVHKLKRKLT